MPWVSLTTRSAGYVVTSDNWNNELINNLKYLKGQLSETVAIESGLSTAGGISIAAGGLTVSGGGMSVVGNADITGSLGTGLYIDINTTNLVTSGVPSNPSSGKIRLFVANDGRIIMLDSSGNQTSVNSGYGARAFLLMGA